MLTSQGSLFKVGVKKAGKFVAAARCHGALVIFLLLLCSSTAGSFVAQHDGGGRTPLHW
jgi:hypothetical protein